MTTATPPESAITPDENKLIAERREKLAAIRKQGVAFPNDFKPSAPRGRPAAAPWQHAQ